MSPDSSSACFSSLLFNERFEISRELFVNSVDVIISGWSAGFQNAIEFESMEGYFVESEMDGKYWQKKCWFMEAHTMVWERAAILSVEIFRLILRLYRHSIIFRAALSLSWIALNTSTSLEWASTRKINRTNGGEKYISSELLTLAPKSWFNKTFH